MVKNEIVLLCELIFSPQNVCGYTPYPEVISFENVVLVLDNTPEKFPTEKRNPNILILQQKLLLA